MPEPRTAAQRMEALTTALLNLEAELDEKRVGALHRADEARQAGRRRGFAWWVGYAAGLDETQERLKEIIVSDGQLVRAGSVPPRGEAGDA